MFEVILKINDKQMVCTTCSAAIRDHIEKYLERKNYLFEYISTDYRTKRVEIVLNTPDLTTVNTIVSGLYDELISVGYDCERTKTQITNVDADVSDQPLAPVITTLPSKKQWLEPLPPLLSGLGLMLAQHLSLLPETLLANLLIGSAATAMTLIVGRHHFRNAFKSASAMDRLITLGSWSALGYSFLVLALPDYFKINNDKSSTFFEVPLVILGLLRLSHPIRDHVQAKIERELDMLMLHAKTLPRTAWVLLPQEQKEIKEGENFSDFLDGEFEQLPVRQIEKGSVMQVKQGNIVPIDSKLLSASAQVREDIFGKKGYTTKQVGSTIFAGSRVVTTVFLKTLNSVGNNQITQAFNSVKRHDGAQQNRLELVSKHFFRAVIVIALICAFFWAIWGPFPQVGHAVQVFFSVLLSACPCAFGLVPLATDVTKAVACQAGILIRDDKVLSIDAATHFVFDKCGTLSLGAYVLHDVVVDGGSEQLKRQYLSLAVLLQQRINSENPNAVANAIIDAAKKWQLDLSKYQYTQFMDNTANPGRGGSIIVNNQAVVVGNKALLNSHGVIINEQWLEHAARFAREEDRLPIYVALAGEVCALIVLESAEEKEQSLRPSVHATMQWLTNKGKTIYWLTGDSKERTECLLNKLPNPNMPIQLIYDQYPYQKVVFIQGLQDEGDIVAYVGDDNNDQGALKQANYALAIDNQAAVRDVAMATLSGSLLSLIQLMCLAKRHRQSNRISVGFAFGFNIIAILFAGGLFYPVTQMMIDPMITGGAMVFSSLALLLNIAVFKKLTEYDLKKIIRDFSGIQNRAEIPVILENNDPRQRLLNRPDEKKCCLFCCPKPKQAFVNSEQSYGTTSTYQPEQWP